MENGRTNGHFFDGRRFTFDGYVVDPQNRVLTRGGTTIPLTGKVFDTLLFLVENPGRLIGKDELLKNIWRKEFVEEGNLARNISTLRKALDDTGKEHKYIATVQGHGYRFVAEVTTCGEARTAASSPPPAALSTPLRALLVIVLIGLSLVVTAAIIRYSRDPERSLLVASPLDQTRITTDGKASRAIISPDGDFVYYTENDELKARNVIGSDTSTLLDASRGFRYFGLAISPDGTSLYFSARQNNVGAVSLFRLATAAGGEPQKVIDEIYGSASFSPDGRRFAFVRRYPELNEYTLFTANADGSGLNRLATTQRVDHFDGAPSWSPDGSTIMCPAISSDGGFNFVILSIDIGSGKVDQVASRRWAWLHSLVWLPDSQRLMIIGQDERAVNAQIWLLDRSTGETRPVSSDSFIYETLSGTSDGTKFVAIKKRLESHIWTVDGETVQRSFGFDKYDGVSGLAWGADGRLFYNSRASGNEAIQQMNADGSFAGQLTPDGGSGFAISPDANYLVTQMSESNSLGLTRIDLKNGSRLRLTEGSIDMTPGFSPDGQFIYFSRYAEKHSINRIPVAGGESSVLYNNFRTVSSPAVSPDQTRIAFAFSRTDADTTRSGIAIRSLDGSGGNREYAVDIRLGTIYEHPTVQWSPDGKFVYYINYNNARSNLWSLNAADGTTQAVTNFTAGRTFNFAYSADGTRLALARGTVESDVLVLKPFE